MTARIYNVFLLLLLGMMASQPLMAGDASTNMMLEFKRAFKSGEPIIRRDLVIKAIDTGLIHRGLSLADARILFDDNLQVFPPKSPDLGTKAVVFFEPVKRSPNPMVSAVRTGWYIDLVFSSDDRLEYYSLSNLHK